MTLAHQFPIDVPVVQSDLAHLAIIAVGVHNLDSHGLPEHPVSQSLLGTVAPGLARLGRVDFAAEATPSSPLGVRAEMRRLKLPCGVGMVHHSIRVTGSDGMQESDDHLPQIEAVREGPIC